MFRSLLVLVPESTVPKRVLARLAALPIAPGAEISLVRIVPRTLRRAARARALADAGRALDAAAGDVVSALGTTINVRRFVRTGFLATELARVARAVNAELVLMGRDGPRGAREVLFGSLVDRVVRSTRRPVLSVVARTGGPYARPLVALTDDDAARGLLAVARRMLVRTHRPVQVLHAYDAPSHGLTYPRLSIDETLMLRASFARSAAKDLTELLRGGAGDSPGDRGSIEWAPLVRYGAARAVIPVAVATTRADLLLIGTRASSSPMRAMLGSVAGDVIHQVPCDVLLVPSRTASAA